MVAKHQLQAIHKDSGWNEYAVKTSSLCGCFHCQKIFLSSEIEEWIREPNLTCRGPGRTAVCPKCGIDAVLPESKEYKITIELLEKMNKMWFLNH